MSIVRGKFIILLMVLLQFTTFNVVADGSDDEGGSAPAARPSHSRAAAGEAKEAVDSSVEDDT